MTFTEDLFEGRAARDAGIQQVIDHNETWIVRAMIATKMLRAAKTLPGEFTGEDIRQAIALEVGLPKHPNGWGALIRQLRSKNVIERTGKTRLMRLKSSHARENPVYRWSTQT